MNLSPLRRFRTLGFVTFSGCLVWGGSLPLTNPAAHAAETIVMKYGPIRRSLPVSDLRQLADTGQPTRQLRSYLKLAKQSSDSLRDRLTQRVSMSVVSLDTGLNSVAGNLLLDEAGRYIHPPGLHGSRQALRSALIVSAADDGQISLLESLENYPTQTIEVDVDRSVVLYRRINKVVEGKPVVPLMDFLNRQIRSFLK
ncbi:MAG: alpha/beta hydrolase [Cyanobacteria bacterium P01_F01_bin.42]